MEVSDLTDDQLKTYLAFKARVFLFEEKGVFLDETRNDDWVIDYARLHGMPDAQAIGVNSDGVYNTPTAVSANQNQEPLSVRELEKQFNTVLHHYPGIDWSKLKSASIYENGKKVHEWNQRLTLNKEYLDDHPDSYVPGLNSVALSVFTKMKSKGFHDKEFNLGEKLMLIVGELGEAQESDRKGRKSDLEGFRQRMKEIKDSLNMSQFHTYEEAQRYLDSERIRFFERYVKDGVEDEIADAIIRLLDLAGIMGIDIEGQITEKMLYNSLRPHKHGKSY